MPFFQPRHFWAGEATIAHCALAETSGTGFTQKALWYPPSYSISQHSWMISNLILQLGFDHGCNLSKCPRWSPLDPAGLLPLSLPASLTCVVHLFHSISLHHCSAHFPDNLQFFESIHSLYCFWTVQVIVSTTDFAILLLQPSLNTSNKPVNNRNLSQFADVQIQTSVSFYFSRLG